MNGRRRILENFKNVILVVLFITTILFLYLLWSDSGTSSFKLSGILPFGRGEFAAPDCGSVILPDYLACGEGDGSFTLNIGDTAPELARTVELLKKFVASPVSVYNVSGYQCKEALTRYKASFLSWSYTLPFTDFCEYYGIESISGMESVRMTGIGLSSAADDSIFIIDNKNGVYYRLISDELKLSPLEPTPKSSFSDGIYYTVEEILGCSSLALLPIIESSKQAPCRYESEAATAPESMRMAMAEGAFGDTFDFVRRITDSFGTVTYMYGYGQKTLTAMPDGSYEYKAETSGESAGFFGDLKTALNFVAACGGWEGEGVESISYRLADAKSIGSGKSGGYAFSFAAYVRGRRIYSESGYPIELRVSAGNVEYYARNVIELRAFAEREPASVSEAANVIASNAGHIYKVMNDDALSATTDEAFSFVADAIVSARMGYYRYERDDSLVPCWAVEMSDGSTFFFDLYEGLPLGFSK